MTWHYLWTNQNLMSDSDKYDNAQEIWNRLVDYYGWTPEATAGVISNFEHEGILNPAQWQIGKTIGDWYDKYTGLGLGQWTPPSKLGNYCGGNTESAISDGDKQIDFTVSEESQWVQRVNSVGYSSYYEMGGIPFIQSIQQYSLSGYEPEDMATCWCACWEGCGKQYFHSTYNSRRTRARYWYEEFGGQQSGYGIYITVIGNGTATAIPSRGEANDPIELRCIPNAPDTLVSIDARDPDGMSIALEQTEVQTFAMKPYDITITVTFTGELPDPPMPVFKWYRNKMPLWMMNKRKRDYYIKEINKSQKGESQW